MHECPRFPWPGSPPTRPCQGVAMNNIRPSFLKTFLAVAHSRNITRAATAVHLAQSSVSDQIQHLESELGTPLFMRAKTGLDLTPAGEVFRQYAEEILALMDEARLAVDMAAGQPARRMAIGALETIAAARVPQWLTTFQASHPGVAVQLKVAGSGELLRLLEGGAIDIALCFDKGERDARLAQRSLSTEALVLVAAPGAQTARHFVATEKGCIYRHLLDQSFAQAGLARPQLAAEVDSIRAITRLVAAGAGLALLPRLAVADELAAGTLVELPWPGPAQATVSLIALWRRRRVQPEALQAFLALAGSASSAGTPLTPGGALLPHGAPSLS